MGSCATCKFFHPFRKPDWAGGHPLGECHALPPVRNGHGEDRDWGEWPKVESSDWCGAFQQASARTIEARYPGVTGG